MRLNEAERILHAAGWHLDRVRSSHRHYRHAEGGLLTLTCHGRRMHVQPEQLLRDIALRAQQRKNATMT